MKKQIHRRIMSRLYSFALPMADTPQIEPRLSAILAASSRRLARPKQVHVAAAVAALAVTLPTLSALHIVGRESRHGSGAAIAAPPALAPTPEKPTTFAETLPPQKRWTRTVPGTGVLVEVVGVSLSQKVSTPPAANPTVTAKTALSQWKPTSSWSPDGVPYSQLLNPSEGFFYGEAFKSEAGKEQRFVELLVRVHNASKQDFRLSNETHGTSGASMSLLTNQGHPNDSGDTFWSITLTNPNKQKRLRLQLRLAAGEFPFHYDEELPLKVPMAQRVGGVKIGDSTAEIAYTSTPPGNQGDYSFGVTYSGLNGLDTRVVALDDQGQEARPMQQAGTGGKDFTQENLVFDSKRTPQSRIAKIRLEARPYQKIDFDDIALYPREAGK